MVAGGKDEHFRQHRAALQTTSAIGDDRLQYQATDRVMPLMP
jgi:predicted metalloprotease